jgi:Fe-S-cluster-containing hydrogenase component 2
MIEIDLEKCTGCKKCECTCAFFHTGRINHQLSRIKVQNLYDHGIDTPVVCVQCKERYCMHCPDNALSLGPDGQALVSPTLCQLCGTCERACPIGAIEIFKELVYVCDLCGGEPKCVEACTEGAIRFVRQKKDAVSLADKRKGKARMGSGQKRYAYAEELGKETRKKWSRKNA